MTASVQDIEKRGASDNNQPNSSDSKKSAKGSVLAYILLPGFIPQIKELGRGGFGYFAFLIGAVYRAVRILPDNHPYTLPENIGKFGIRQVVAAAANNIKLDKQHIDQIIVFFAVLAAIVILILQIAGFLLLLLSGEAWASDVGPNSFGGLFKTQHPDTDIAFHMMREVFGIPDMFGTLKNGQTAFHKGLHVMFNFYNLAILLVAVLVFLYYVVVVVAETAQTGTPFGKRFSHIYAPFRLVIAIGLLVPLPGESAGTAMNGAQYITLFAAKTGSGFATTGWTQFNSKIDNPAGVENATLIADTKAPDVDGLVSFMATAITCREAYKILEQGGAGGDHITMKCVQKDPGGKDFMVKTPCDQALSITKASDVKVTFGKNFGSNGFFPECGTAVIPITAPVTAASKTAGNPGAIQKDYLALMRKIWEDVDLRLQAYCFIYGHVTYEGEDGQASCGDGPGYTPPSSERDKIASKYRAEIRTLVLNHYKKARKEVDFKMREQVKRLGWGGAGIWYNRIAEANGAYVVTAMSVPSGEKKPRTMEWIKEKRKGSDGKYKGCKAYEPNLADSKDVDFVMGDRERKYAAIFNDVHQYWTCDKASTAPNIFVSVVESIFGLNGLMDMRQSTKGLGKDGEEEILIHPLAKLSALGSSLVNSAVRNLGFAVGTSFVGGLLGIFSDHLGTGAKALSGLLVSIATIGLGIGFLTFYILPILPFIYFFFAVGGWVKGIFEAMVGAPLWALAHLRIDGDGIPGKMAMNGYFLILEIFLRPILTVFGLIGGMAIFTALAMILHEVFSLVVLNSAGIDIDKDDDTFFSRNSIDQFFFTCMYAVILYMMAVSSFKMINLVPNMILRWIGGSVSAFNDKQEDPTQGLTQYAALGGAKIGDQMAGAMTQLASIPGAAGQGLKKGLGGDIGRILGRKTR